MDFKHKLALAENKIYFPVVLKNIGIVKTEEINSRWQQF